MRLCTVYILLVIIWSCSSTSSEGPKYDLKGFETENIGGGAQLVSYRAADGSLVARGTILNGVRNGTWLTFHSGKNSIEVLTTYVNGRKNGVEITFNERGQIESRIDYKNDVLHGLNAKYRFGRPTEEISYKDGVMDGPFSIFDNQGLVQRKGAFKAGKQHGILQYFDDKGNVTLQYEYRNGEKISGGIVGGEDGEN